MLRASSKRAFSSTITDTSLPAAAARLNAWAIAEGPPGRYSVSLIDWTSGSSAASAMKRSKLA